MSTSGQTKSLGTLPIDEFTSVPGKNDPKEFSFRYQWRLIESFKVYLTKVAESFRIPLSAQLEVVQQLDPKLRFSTEVFSLYVRLRDAYLQKDLHGIFDALQLIKNFQLIRAYCPECRCESILTENWETLFVEEMRLSHPVDEEKDPLTRSIRMFPLIQWNESDYPPRAVVEAKNLIQELDYGLWNEFEAYTTRIKLFSGRVLSSVTSARFFGSIYIRLPYPEEDPLLFYFEFLVHEVSHLHLHAMMGEDPMVLNSDSERFTSPLRPDKRPMSGIFHATFVLARIVRAFRKFHVHNPHHLVALETLKKCENLLLEGLSTVDKYAQLSPQGRAIFLSMEPCAFEC